MFLAHSRTVSLDARAEPSTSASCGESFDSRAIAANSAVYGSGFVSIMGMDAVQAALTLPWSNGLVEGQVHRLKLIKRKYTGAQASISCAPCSSAGLICRTLEAPAKQNTASPNVPKNPFDSGNDTFGAGQSVG